MNRGTLGAAIGVAILVGIVSIAFTLFQGARETTALKAELTQQLGTKASSDDLAGQARGAEEMLKNKLGRAGDTASSLVATDYLEVSDAFKATSADGGRVAISGTLVVGEDLFVVDSAANSVWASQLTVEKDVTAADLYANGVVQGDALQNSGKSFSVDKSGFVNAGGVKVQDYFLTAGSPFYTRIDHTGMTIYYAPIKSGDQNLTFGMADHTKPYNKDTNPVVLHAPVIRTHRFISEKNFTFDDSSVIIGQSASVGDNFAASALTTPTAGLANGAQAGWVFFVQKLGKTVSVNGTLSVSDAIAGPGVFSVDSDGDVVAGTLTAASADLGTGALTAGSATVGVVTAGSGTVTGTLGVGGTISGPGGFVVDASGIVTTGGISAADGDFTVDGAGNVHGTSLSVDGSVAAATLVGSTSVQTPRLLAGPGGHIDADTLNVQGDFSVEGSTPGDSVFTVDSSTGNASVEGTLTVGRDMHVARDLYVDGLVYGNTSTSNLTIKHTLKVDKIAPDTSGALELSAHDLNFIGTGDFVVDASTTTINGTLTVEGDVTVNGDVAVGGGHAFDFGNGAGTITIDAGNTSASTGAIGFTIGNVVASPSQEATSWWVTHSGQTVTVHMSDPQPSAKDFDFIAVK